MDIVLAIVIAASSLCIAVYSLRYVYDYRIRNETIEIVLFGFLPIYKVDIRNVLSIAVGTWRDLGVGLFTVRFGNRLTLNNMVLIEKNQGLFHRVVITPKDPHAFVAKVKSLRRRLQ